MNARNNIVGLRHIKHPFPAVISPSAKVLILGSVPSLKSVENNFYYMHPQNRFWKVLSAILDEELYSASTSEKARIVSAHNIALYDSIEECDILGSSDNDIYNAVAANIPSLLEQSRIIHIFCNGAASYKYLISAYPQYKSIAVKLPSTSPANASASLENLIEQWSVIKQYLS